MARLSAKQRSAVRKSDFAIPSKAGSAKAKKKSGNYPIPDRGHAIAAKRLVAQHGTPAEKAEVRAAVARKFPNLGKKSTPVKARPKARSRARMK